ncbi:MAG: NUDIX domain-containing protein [Gudongella sp.]|nr:NUDIX domain-containing protein [Gudongella sp.]
MLCFRNIVTAFLFYEDQVLLMKRGEDREIAPGYWFGVGGHIEPEEINNPYRAIYREILEETGISSEKVSNFSLKYIVYNRDVDRNEIIVNHIFFGNLDSKEFVDSDEGKLFWVDKEDVLEKEFHPIIKIILASYFKNKRQEILLGVVGSEEPYTWWYPL